jgi:hypothetical protein
VSCGEVGGACGRAGDGVVCGTEAADLGGVAVGTVWAAGSGDDAGDGDAAACG